MTEKPSLGAEEALKLLIDHQVITTWVEDGATWWKITKPFNEYLKKLLPALTKKEGMRTPEEFKLLAGYSLSLPTLYKAYDELYAEDPVDEADRNRFVYYTALLTAYLRDTQQVKPNQIPGRTLCHMSNILENLMESLGDG